VQQTPDDEVLEFQFPSKLTDLLGQLQEYPFAEKSESEPDALLVLICNHLILHYFCCSFRAFLTRKLMFVI